MSSVGHKISHENHLGVTCLRNGFANDVNNAPINVDQCTLLSALMINTTGVRLSTHNNTAAQWYMHRANAFNTGVKADSVQFFVE